MELKITTDIGTADIKLYDTLSAFYGASIGQHEITNQWNRWQFDSMSYTACLNAVRDGDLSGVAMADKYLSALEDTVIVSSGYRVTDDVVGAMPNVPAYLSGNPYNMRLRRRVAKESAPLAIFADLTSSASLTTKQVAQRGAAILALVRLLSQRRPIELWVGAGLNRGTNATLVFTRLDTAPLDLARAAHMLTAETVSRGLCYGLCKVGAKTDGGFPFGDIDRWRKHGRDILSRAIAHSSEVLFIPPVFANDKAINRPAEWLSDMLAAYGGLEQEAA